LTHLLQAFKLFALIICCVVLWDVHGLIRDARVTIRGADPILGNINQAASDLSGMTKVANSAMSAETGRIAASTKELQKTEASVRLLVVRTNESLNGSPNVAGLLPTATGALRSATALSDGTLARIDRTADSLEPSLLALNRGTTAFANAASDPNIPVTLANLGTATKSAADGMAQVAAIATDGRQVADKARETYLKPVNLWYALSKEMTHWAFELKGIL